MVISLIVAHDKNYAIGNNNQLLWKLSDDLKLFKKTTLNKTIIMGKNTYLSIGKPLPNRTNIVLSRLENQFHEDVITLPSIEDAIEFGNKNQLDELIFIGGAEIYRQILPLVDRMYITKVDAKIEHTDAYFEPIDENNYKLELSENYQKNEKNEYDFSFNIYNKI